MLSAVIALSVLAAVFGLLLGYAAIRFKVKGDPMVDKVDALLPQTQCGQCTYPGCRPYAQAIADGEADINQCPPGGETTIIALADLLGRDPKPLNAENGVEEDVKTVAWPLSMKKSASAAPCVFRPARWMRFSVPPNKCIR